MKKYNYILLDWDGNLAKTLDIWLDATRIVLEKHGIHKTDEQIGASFGQLTTCLQQWGVSDPQAAYDEVDRIGKQVLPEVDLYPDALPVLRKLHEAGKHLALITTSPRVHVEHLLVKHGIQALFEVVIAGDDVEHHKPHPEPLEKALAALGATKQSAVMIGDSDKDIGAARNCGVDSILFYPHEHRKFYDLDKLKALNPTYIVHDFKEVIQHVV